MSAGQPAHQLDPYLDATDVARMLKVSTKSVLRWASSDKSMPTLRIGKTVRFPRERLMAWLREREQGRLCRRLSPSLGTK
jgi:excisionase family DNA binding protein